jgi:hypothetical protein
MLPSKKLSPLLIALCLLMPTPAKSFNEQDLAAASCIGLILAGCWYLLSDDTPAQQPQAQAQPPKANNQPSAYQEDPGLQKAIAESLKTHQKEQQKTQPSAPALHELPTIQNLSPFNGIDVDSSMTVDVKHGQTNVMRLHSSANNQSVTAQVVNEVLLLRRAGGHGGPLLDQKQTPVGVSITATNPVSLCTITGSNSQVTVDARGAQNFDLYNMGRHSTATITNLNTQRLIVQNSEACTARLHGKTNILALSAAAKSSVFAKTLRYDNLTNSSHRGALIELAEQARG